MWPSVCVSCSQLAVFRDDESKRSVAKGSFGVLLSRLFTAAGSQQLIQFVTENLEYLLRSKCPDG